MLPHAAGVPEELPVLTIYYDFRASLEEDAVISSETLTIASKFPQFNKNSHQTKHS